MGMRSGNRIFDHQELIWRARLLVTMEDRAFFSGLEQ